MGKRSTPRSPARGFGAVTPAQARKLEKALAAASRRQVSYKGVDTRRRQKAERSERSKKGWATRRAQAKARSALRNLLDAAARGAGEDEWEDIRPDWQSAKEELYEAVEEDFDRYAEILDELADDEGTDWAIAYGPETE